MPLIAGIVIGLVLLLCLALVIAVARDRGPGPGEVAVSYELAWDRLDFDALWALSGPELRDGLDRKHFIAAKRSAYDRQPALRGLVEHVEVGEVALARSGDAAVVSTNVDLRDGKSVHNTVQLARRQSKWQVVAYRLASAAS
ncbi:MAG TPA: hypothetical protein VH986_14350 [Acidimicrobiia bacterium]